MKAAGKAPSLWVPRGEEVRIGGYRISEGMVYAGPRRMLRAEPSLIDPSLPLDPASRLALPLDGWVPCSNLTPAARASYLEWLAGGRSAPGIPEIFLYFFFSGIERRVLSDLRPAKGPNPEILRLIAEVERLLEVYGEYRRFAHCAAYFVALARLLAGDLRPDALEPLLDRISAHNRIIWQIGPALFTAAGRPPSPRWAFELWSGWNLAHRAAPAFRCPVEVRALFLIHYSEILPAALLFPPRRSPLVVHYQPTNPSLPAPFVLRVNDVPEVVLSREHMAELQRVADRVFTDLSPYSRWIGRTDRPSSPAALALLPPELARGRESEESRRLVRWIEKTLAGGGYAALSRQDIATHWPVQKRLNRRDLESFATFLGRSGYGIEPEPRLEGPLPERGCFLFRLADPEEGWTWLPGPAYTTAALVLQLAVAVATADGPADPRQEEHLLGHVLAAAHLGPMERARLQFRLAWLLAEPQSLAGCRERCAALGEPQRRTVARFLITVAGADGHVSPGEIRQLKKVYRLLGRDPEALYADIHALAAGSSLAAEPAAGGSLDLGQVEGKLAETEQVSVLLGEIFKEDELAVPAAGAVTALDTAHAALLHALAARTSWSRAEVERLAADLGLLPDGALEILNEVALARCDAPLLEGDERIEIDPDILEELLA